MEVHLFLLLVLQWSTGTLCVGFYFQERETRIHKRPQSAFAEVTEEFKPEARSVLAAPCPVKSTFKLQFPLFPGHRSTIFKNTHWVVNDQTSKDY